MIGIDLLQEAMTASPEFTEKLGYWIHKRKRVPDSQWVVLRLIEALGYDRVQQYIMNKKDLENGKVSKGAPGRTGETEEQREQKENTKD